MNNEELKSKISSCLKECEIPSESVMAISSLDLVTLAVKLEKIFKIRFALDEISEDNFSTIDKIQAIIKHKLG